MKIRISNEILLIYFVLLPYLKPYNVTLIPWLDSIFKVWKIAATMVVFVLFFCKRKKLQMHNVFLFAFLFVWIASILINDAPKDFFNNILSVIGITLFFEINSPKKQFRNNVTAVLKNIAVWNILLNFITVIQGSPFAATNMKLADNANFLGGDNYSAFILIVYCGFLCLYDIQRFKRIRLRTCLYICISLSCLLLTFALTGFLAHFVLIIALLLRNVKPFSSWIRPKYVLCFTAAFVIAVGYLHLDQALAGILGGIGKDGFNGRIWIWPFAINGILNKPLFGFGGITPELAQTWILAGANHTHNILLEYPFSTGLVGTAFFVAYLSGLKDYKAMWRNRECSVLLCTLFAFLFCSILDYYIGLIHFYLLLSMLYLYKQSISDSKVIVNGK